MFFEKSRPTEKVNITIGENTKSKLLETPQIKNPYFICSEDSLRSLCRNYIESFENWSRRLIDYTFREKYGNDYFNFQFENGNSLIKSELIRNIEKRIMSNTSNFPRKIDAIMLDDIKYLFCKNEIYNDIFKGIFEPFFSGRVEIRNKMQRLIDIRNKLSHANAISIREVEQCICYIGDFIDSFKAFFIRIGKENDYNVPVFLSIKDSLGNQKFRDKFSYDWEIEYGGTIGELEKKIQFRSGESYKLWVEVDGSFSPLLYDIEWKITQYNKEIISGQGNIIEYTFTNENVSYRPKIEIKLTTKKDWHRFGNVDDRIVITYADVLPPIEDTF